MWKKSLLPILSWILLGCGGLLLPFVALSGHTPPVTSGVSVTLQFEGGGSPPPTQEAGGIFPYPFFSRPSGVLILRGFGPPRAFLSLIKNKTVGATLRVDGKGEFQIFVESVSNLYELQFFAEDEEGNTSQSIVLSQIPVFSEGTTTIENIFIPPTIVLDTPEVEGGGTVKLHGFTVPNTGVDVLFLPALSVKRVTSDTRGRWGLSFPASELAQGSYEVKAHAQLASGLLSGFSQIVGLAITTGLPFIPVPSPEGPFTLPITPASPEYQEQLKKVDFNVDAKIDLTDLSIFLYNWGEPKDPRADFNKDGIVDLIDFSIMLFFWSG